MQLLLGSGVLLLFASIWLTRSALGIDLDPRSMRDFVADLGPAGPLVYILLVTFRVPLGVPSQLVLIAGGLIFGTAAGTLYGASGLTISAILLFWIARWAGRDAVEARLAGRFSPALDAASHRWGAGFIAVGTAYPFGPISAYHGLSGVTRMAPLTFLATAILGSLGRSFVYTYFGSSLMEGNLNAVVLASGALALAFVAPLLHPRSRRWVRELLRPRATAESDDAPAGSPTAPGEPPGDAHV